MCALTDTSVTVGHVRALYYPEGSVSAWQAVKESSWQLAPESAVTRRIAEGDARYALILNRPEGFSAKLADSASYAGPAHFDIDTANIGDAIAVVRQLGAKLAVLGFDLEQARWYASGSKGFHCEIPPACFRSAPFAFVAGLPYIFREMVQSAELYIEGIDLSIYSGKLGRMWRSPNVRRENGCFKVPVTWGEIETMTAEAYASVAAAPRPFPAIQLPTLNNALALLYSKAEAKVRKARGLAPARSADGALWRRFGQKLPPSLALLARGRIASRKGFQQIATQLAIAGNALGIGEDDLIKQCNGLVESHRSDSDRYNTPAKRVAELRRMHRYMRGNPDYTVSAAGIRAVLPRGLRTPDLAGL